jgi:hypothetical protein
MRDTRYDENGAGMAMIARTAMPGRNKVIHRGRQDSNRGRSSLDASTGHEMMNVTSHVNTCRENSGGVKGQK